MPRRGSSGEAYVALFLLGVVLLTPPFLTIFSNGGWLFGIPLLYVYLFLVWAALIGLVALASEGGRHFPGPRQRPGPPGKTPGKIPGQSLGKT